MADAVALREEIKDLIVRTLNLEDVDVASIDDNQPLFGAGLGLDSVDALELVVALEKRYGVKLEAHEVDRNAFGSVASLATLVAQLLERQTAARS
jgi:acyl carrier protein